MTQTFDYEFDGPVTRFTLYGVTLCQDDVVELLNDFTDALRKIEAIAAKQMSEYPHFTGVYRIACEALNNAGIVEA